jgi:hypothetical protein
MKEVMFNLSSDSGDVRSFEYAPVKSPQLPLLYNLSKPHSIEALKEILMRECTGKSMTVQQVYQAHSVNTPYIFRNFQDAIIALEAEDKVAIDKPAAKRQRNGEVTLGRDRTVTFPPSRRS